MKSLKTNLRNILIATGITLSAPAVAHAQQVETQYPGCGAQAKTCITDAQLKYKRGMVEPGDVLYVSPQGDTSSVGRAGVVLSGPHARTLDGVRTQKGSVHIGNTTRGFPNEGYAILIERDHESLELMRAQRALPGADSVIRTTNVRGRKAAVIDLSAAYQALGNEPHAGVYGRELEMTMRQKNCDNCEAASSLSTTISPARANPATAPTLAPAAPVEEPLVARDTAPDTAVSAPTSAPRPRRANTHVREVDEHAAQRALSRAYAQLAAAAVYDQNSITLKNDPNLVPPGFPRELQSTTKLGYVRLQGTLAARAADGNSFVRATAGHDQGIAASESYDTVVVNRTHNGYQKQSKNHTMPSGSNASFVAVDGRQSFGKFAVELDARYEHKKTARPNQSTTTSEYEVRGGVAFDGSDKLALDAGVGRYKHDIGAPGNRSANLAYAGITLGRPLVRGGSGSARLGVDYYEYQGGHVQDVIGRADLEARVSDRFAFLAGVKKGLYTNRQLNNNATRAYVGGALTFGQ